MNDDLKKFLESCFELAKELLDKENLSEKEEKFLKNFDLIIEKYMGL